MMSASAAARVVGVAVGLREHEPVTLNVTDDRNEVLYVTVMVALPAPLTVTEAFGRRSTGPVWEGSESK